MAEAILELVEAEESEMSSMEIDELRDVLEDVLVSSGRFSAEKIGGWLDGFDVCEVDEHRHNLIVCAHDFIKSGEEQDEGVNDLVEINLLSRAEQSEISMRIQKMDYGELRTYIQTLESMMKEARELEKSKLTILKNPDLRPDQVAALIGEFESKSIDGRKKMVTRLPSIVAKYRYKNQSAKVVSEIQDLISGQRISEARSLLDSGAVAWEQHRVLDLQISEMEMDMARDYLLAA